MTAPDVTRIVAESRAAQGLPPKVTDPATLGRVVAILTTHKPADASRPRQVREAA